MIKNLRKYENFHIVLWLIKDTCWCADFHIAGVIMVVPTFLAAVHITWLSRKNRMELFHNMAVSSWIIANGIWMIGEFFFKDTLRPYSIIFFAIGLLVIAIYYIFLYKKEDAAEAPIPTENEK